MLHLGEDKGLPQEEMFLIRLGERVCLGERVYLGEGLYT